MTSRCPQCGEEPAGYANIDGVRYCHGDERPSCYERAQRRTGLIDDLTGLTDGLLESVQRELTKYIKREQGATSV